MYGCINEMMSICILCIGMILFWKGYKYGYMCIYMYLFVIKDFKELLIKIIGYLSIFIYKKFEKLVSKKNFKIYLVRLKLLNCEVICM